MTTSAGPRCNPRGHEEWPNPRALIAELEALSGRFARDAETVQESLAQAVGEVRNENLFVRVVAGRVEALKVTEALGRRGLVQARETVLAAFSQALVQSNRRGAAAVAFVPGGAEVSGGVRSSLPAEAAGAAERYDAEHVADGHDQGQEFLEAGEPTDPFTREVLDELLADLSIDDEPRSVDELARELDFDNNRVPGDPSTWQSTLESDIAALSAKAGELPGLLGRVTGAAETKRVKVMVNAGGGLLDIRFRPRCFSDTTALNTDITTVLTEATREASMAALTAIRDVGWVGQNDATVQLLARGLATDKDKVST